jgi:glucokinase
MSPPLYLGFDIGGSKMLALALDPQGHTLGRWRRPTGPGFSPERAVAEMEAVLQATRDIGEVRGIGIGFPGLVRSGIGTIASSVMLVGWDGFPLQARAEDRFRISCRVENDVNNAARAERLIRESDQSMPQDFLFMAVGTGIGGALVLGGVIWGGSSGLAGEVGHVSTGLDVRCECGRRGCVGAVAGGRAAAGGGNPVRSAYWVGAVAADAMNLLNLPLVVLGGGVALGSKGYRAAVDQSFRENALKEVSRGCRIELARTGNDAGALGSAIMAMEAMGVRPHRLVMDARSGLRTKEPGGRG